jgi:hypothetical protein
MIEWTIQRPTTTWITTKVQAETLEEALKAADQNFYEGEYKQDEETFTVDRTKYWASNEYDELFIKENQEA